MSAGDSSADSGWAMARGKQGRFDHNLHRGVASYHPFQGCWAITFHNMDGVGRNIDKVSRTNLESLIQAFAHEEPTTAARDVQCGLAVHMPVGTPPAPRR